MPKPAPKGFTLIEVIATLALVAVFSALVIPIVFRTEELDRIQAAGKKLKAVQEAILGDPQNGTFGFVGDVGRRPTALSELITQPGNVPAFTTTGTTGGVGMGWKGPYLKTEFNADPLTDTWGSSLSYNSTTGQITSPGADRALSTADDIVFPPNPSADVTGRLIVNVYVLGDPNPSGTTVQVFQTVNGSEASQTKTRPADQFFFDVPHGIHAVRATPPSGIQAVPRTMNVLVPAGALVSIDIILPPTGEGRPPFDFGRFQHPSGDLINAGILCLMHMGSSNENLLTNGTVLGQIQIVVKDAEILAFTITSGGTDDEINVAAQVLLDEGSRLLNQILGPDTVPDSELRRDAEDCTRSITNGTQDILNATN